MDADATILRDLSVCLGTFHSLTFAIVQVPGIRSRFELIFSVLGCNSGGSGMSYKHPLGYTEGIPGHQTALPPFSCRDASYYMTFSLFVVLERCELLPR